MNGRRRRVGADDREKEEEETEEKGFERQTKKDLVKAELSDYITPARSPKPRKTFYLIFVAKSGQKQR